MKQKGFTLIEIVVSVAILLVIVMGVYQGYAMLYKALSHNHFKITATDLANEQFELVRNLGYSSVGVVGGTPAGVLPAVQTLTRGGVAYTVSLSVQSVNDPFDNVPADPFPNDYKLVQVSVVCQSCQNLTPIIITGQVAPANLESS